MVTYFLRSIYILLFLGLFLMCMPSVMAASSSPGGYGLKIYRVNSALYPYVQVYIRTFDHNKQPLVNLNAMNIGLMVKGRSYNPVKQQYFIQTIRQRSSDAIRSVIILDTSGSMRDKKLGKQGFVASLEAAARFIDGKRSQDEIAILAIDTSKEGYSMVSGFERDREALARRLLDVKNNAVDSRIYDTIGAAMQMCATSSQGSSIEPSVGSFIASCSILVFSDGRDEGSALSREELNARITKLDIPVPIYSLAYGHKSAAFFRNLESISKNSFGVYYLIGETANKMTQVVESIQNILLSDYVVTFRSFIGVDGEEHALKVGVEYPSGSKKLKYSSTQFEAIEALPFDEIVKAINMLNVKIPAPTNGNPYFDKNSTQ